MLALFPRLSKEVILEAIVLVELKANEDPQVRHMPSAYSLSNRSRSVQLDCVPRRKETKRKARAMGRTIGGFQILAP